MRLKQIGLDEMRIDEGINIQSIMALATVKNKISQQILFAAITTIDTSIKPASVQQLVRNLYRSVFHEFLSQQHLSQAFAVRQPTPKENDQVGEYESARLRRIDIEGAKAKQYGSSHCQAEDQDSQDQTESQGDGLQVQSLLLDGKGNTASEDTLLKIANEHGNTLMEDSYMQNAIPTKSQFKKLPTKQRIQLLKTIKASDESAEEKERIKRMKLHAFKSTSRFYSKMLCEPLELDFQQQYKMKELQTPGRGINQQLGLSGGLGDDNKQSDKRIAKQSKQPAKNEKTSKKQQKNQIDDQQLQKWFTYGDDMGQDKLGTDSDMKKMNRALDYLDAQPQAPQVQHILIQGKMYTAAQLRQHHEISKALCFYSQRFSAQQVASIDPLDNPEFVETYFNMPQFSRQDRIQLQTNKQQFMYRLYKSIDVLKVFMKHGYGIRIYKQATYQDLGKDKYTHFIWFALRLGFRQIEKFLIIDCQKPIPYLTYVQVHLISMTLFRIREMYSQKSRKTFFDVLKAVFKLQNIVHLCKNDIFAFYNQLRKRLVQRRDAIQNKLTLIIQKQKQMDIKYKNYSQDGQIDFFGLQNGILGVKHIYDEDQRIYINQGQRRQFMRRWSEQFECQFLKLYMQYRKLGEIRKHLLKRFKGPFYQNEFNLKKNLYKKVEKLCRRCIELVQLDYRKYCEIMGIQKLNFYQKKLMTMNYCQIRVVCLCQEALDLRLLIIDYFLNNMYGKNRNDKTNLKLVKYRLTYINYMIESMAQFLQNKKKLSQILVEPEQQRFRLFDIKTIVMSKWQSKNKDIVHLEEDTKQIHAKIVEELENIRKFWQTKGYQGLARMDKDRPVPTSKFQKNQEQQDSFLRQTAIKQQLQPGQQTQELGQKVSQHKSRVDVKQDKIQVKSQSAEPQAAIRKKQAKLHKRLQKQKLNRENQTTKKQHKINIIKTYHPTSVII